jgi:hypothetical protein
LQRQSNKSETPATTLNRSSTKSSSYLPLTQTVQNILRKYPSKYNFDGMFLDLVALLDLATDVEAK